MKKKIFIITSIIVVLSVVLALYLFNIPSLKEERIFEINSQVKIQDLFTSNNHLINSDELVTVDTIGTHSLTYSYKNIFGIKENKQTFYQVVDTTNPTIEVKEDARIIIGSQSIEELFTIADNSNAFINVQIINDYNLKVASNYNVIIVATDESGNSSQKELSFNVYDTEMINGSIRHYFLTSKDFLGYTIDGKTYIDGCLIANKTYSLPASYNASNNHSAKDMNGLDETTRKQFQLLIDAAQKEGYTIKLGSGFRGYDYQKALYNKRVKEKGFDYAEVYVARAGYSEHQTGLAFDVNSCNDNFTKTKEYQWMLNNCYKYGFIIRYPEGKSNETGYSFESWHYRYVGKELAEKLYNNGNWLSLEDYFGITSVY